MLFFNQLFWQSSYLPLSLPLALSVQSICINVLKIRLSICYITKCLVFRWVQMQATVFEMTIFKSFSWVSFSAVLICVAACLRRCLSSFKTVDLYKRFFFLDLIIHVHRDLANRKLCNAVHSESVSCANYPYLQVCQYLLTLIDNLFLRFQMRFSIIFRRHSRLHIFEIFI